MSVKTLIFNANEAGLETINSANRMCSYKNQPGESK